jgi:hypothetical protein
MKHAILSFCALLVLAGSGFAGKTAVPPDYTKESVEADFPAGGLIRMHIRSGELRIVGSDESKIRVHYLGKKIDKSGDVKVSLKTTGNAAELSVNGGPRNDFQIEVQVPRNSNLYLRMPFGEVRIDSLTGDKDVELHAGELTLGIGQPEDYFRVDTSVYTGDLDTGPFGVEKGGLFRSFEEKGSGQYRLHAHVGAGELTLKK